MQPGGLCGIARLALQWRVGTGSEEEAGSWARGGHVRFSHASLSCRKSSALPFGSSRPCHVAGAGSRAQGTPAFCPAPVKQQRGKQRGWNCSSEKDLSDQDPSSFSRIGASSSCLNSSCHLLTLLPDGAGTEEQSRLRGQSGCPQGMGKGRKGQSPSRWDEGLQSKVGSEESAVVRGTTGLPSRRRNNPKSPLLQQYWVIGKGKSIKYTQAKNPCRYKREQNTRTAKMTTCPPGDAQHLAQQKYPKFLK